MLLKRIGCRIVLGKGHRLVDPQPYMDEGLLVCHGCGHTVLF
jgi:hypothetical protein